MCSELSEDEASRSIWSGIPAPSWSSRQQTATFSNEPNSPFLVKGSDAPQSWWDLNAAVNIDLSKSFSLYLNVEADIAPAIANTMRYGGGFLFRF